MSNNGGFPLSNDISKQLESLRKQDRAALNDLWYQLFGRMPSRKLRKDTMFRVLAYKIQENANGHLRAGTRRELRQLLDKYIQNAFPTPLRLRPGTRLIREWQGQIHNVIVAERGYEYDGQQYGSLSEIAHLITGTKWSGPIFFGLKLRGKYERRRGANVCS